MSMQTSYNADILRGGCQELPNVRSKVVRIFLSSTFSDTLAERDSLIEHVFPRLKDYCREKYGLEFQYADMRWGIQTASSDNHSEVQTCLNEIELCRKYSLATNFVVLLSHRYGSRPVPATIRALLFEQLHEILRSNANHIDDAELLSQWYQLDTNPIPAVYVLRPISSILPKILSTDTIEMKAANKEWKKVNNRIHKCLRIAAIELLKQGQILEDEYDDFFISVTEKEIVKGILSVSNANERTLCFLREIEDISDHLIDRKASKFIDMTSSLDGQLIVDSEAETLLNRLKYTRIPNVLQSQNIFSYKVRWKSDGINQNDHADYITRFNKDFYDAIQKQIDHCVQTNAMVVSEPLQREVLEHAIQCKTYIAKFHGRTDVMDKLEKFIDNTKEHRPCIVYGASGCGKTSVLAKVANEVVKWWSSKSVSVILRFLGTTPSSSTITKTLLSISQHICQLYKLSMEIYSDVQQLRHQLERNLFIQIPSDEYLIIILDSIDQLETDAYDCQWLPRYFPENIKCIVSTLPDHGNILSNLKSLINNDSSVLENTEHLLVFVPPFQPAIVEIVYNDWLKMKQRSLSVEQRVFITSLMEKQTEILPLYMKLVFDIVSTWHSYDPINNALRRLTSIDACIRYLFDQLEKIHSSMLFSRAICYMTACRNGISQNELEDVLSLDDDVLKSVFQHYIPPVRRVPGILWTRIRNDLDEYITEKEVDDSPVIYWYHRRFIEFVNDAYISALDDDERKTIVENMIDLYKETWKGKSKPFKIDNPNLLHKYNLSQSDGRIDANRLITSQPIEFIDIHGQVQFNRRKLNELPQFLSQLTSSLAIPVVAEEIVFNYCFMYAKLRCSPFNDIVSELVKFTQVSSYRLSEEVLAIKCEMIIFYMVYMISGIKLQEYPNNYAFELSARLLILYGIKPNITRLLKQLDEQSIHHCALIVPYTQLPPASGLIFSMHLHTTSIVEIDFTDNNMTTISLSDKIVVFDIEQLKTVLTVNLPQLNEPYLNSTTLTGISYDNENNENESSPSGGSDPTRFQRYSFLVNSLHHLYLISAQEKIKFHRASKIGFLTVEILCSNRGLAVIAEINGDSIECWDLVNDRLFDRIQCSSSPIQAVQCLSTYNMIITKLKDGTISFHSITDWTSSSFVLRASIKSDIRLDLIIPVGHFLLCTFDATSSICFALIDIKSFNRTDRVLSNQEILKTLITFDPPMTSKPIERIVLPDENLIKAEDKQSEFPLFIAKTKDTMYVVHQCKNKNISYVQINGQYDVICIYPQEQKIIFTSHRSIIEMHKWACVQNEVENSINIPDCLHKYQLYVSIDTGSAHVTAIMPSLDYATVFLCSMQNGVIQAYSATHAREALECIPPFERSTHVTKAIQLLRATAITVDVSKRELTAWSYQHSASIQSTHVYHAAVTISEFAIVPCNADPQMIFVFVLTSNHYIEIYSSKALDKEPLFTYFLRYPAKIHTRMNGTFLLLTNRGSIHSIAQRTDPSEFYHLEHIQLKIQCSMMFSSIVTLHSSEHLIIVSDDGQSMAIWTSEQVIIYVDIKTPLLPLKSLHGHSIQDSILLYLHDKTLISCRIQLDQSMNSGSVQMNPCGRADQFCFKNHYLMTLTSEKNQLDLQDIRSKSSHKQIQLESPCEHLCFNESSTYVFVVVKPRILFMFRTIDGQQLAKLFLFDFVSSMIADNDFIVLAMTDRRLLTLMIADPKDPTVQTKIQALPSRNPQLANESMTNNLLQHLEKYANNSSVEEERDFNDDDNQSDHQKITQKTVPPVSHLRIVTRLTGRHSLSKMSSNPAMTSRIMTIFSYNSENQDVADLIHDSDSDDDVECSNPLSTTIQQQPVNDSQDIYQKILQHEQEQIKGIQLANAGSGNLNVVNNYSVTSNTCVLI